MRSNLLISAAMAIALASGGMMIGTGYAQASGSSTACEADGGTYTKDGPDSICTYPETTKDVNGNAYGTTTQETTTGQGNLENDPVTTCTGNPGHCK